MITRWRDETGVWHEGLNPQLMPTLVPLRTAVGPNGTYSAWRVSTGYAITRDDKGPTRIDRHPIRDWAIERVEQLANMTPPNIDLPPVNQAVAVSA